jgi:hypothetical protein
MSAKAAKPVVPLAYQRTQAATALGVSADHFDKYVRPHLKCVYVGDVKLWSAAELQRWLDERGVRPR